MGFLPIIREDVDLIVEYLAERIQEFAGKTMLITGSGGFLCSYFLDFAQVANEMLSKPFQVVSLDNFLTGWPDRIHHLESSPYIQFIKHDVSKPLEYDGPLDYIIHGASIASPMVYRQYPLETIDVNVNGTWHMLELAKEKSIKSMLFLSSSEVYGDPDPAMVPTSEEYNGNVSCTGPRACYDESKRLGETLCTTYWRKHQVPVKMIRPFNVYGPGQRLDDKRIIPDVMSGALRREPIVLLSNGLATRSFCYVTDAVCGMLEVLLSEHNAEAFNVGNDQEVTIREVAETAATLDVKPLEVRYETSEDPDYLCDNPNRRCPNLTKLRGLGNWKPTIMLRDGLSRTLRYYRELELAK